jgi:hypothetical protein
VVQNPSRNETDSASQSIGHGAWKP